MTVTINKNQIQIIHVLKSKLNISDDDYRSMLFDNYKQRSSTRLTFDQATKLIQGLKRLAGDLNNSPWRDVRQHISSDRPGMATTKQIGMLLGIWSEVSVLPPKDQRNAFEKFLINRFGIGGLRMLSKELVGQVRHALIAMKNKPRRDAKPLRLSNSKEQLCQL